MSKTIAIVQDGTEYTIHLDRFAEDAKHIQQTREFGSTWSHTWLRAGLIAFQENGDVSLTPRGEDLLASLPCLPNDPEPATAAKPCSKCHGSGEQVLFAYMEMCDRCKGSKIEPGRLAGVDFSALVGATKEHPWVLIDSEKVARQFVGKHVLIDAPGAALYQTHSTHGQVLLLSNAHADHLYFNGGGCIYWSARGNVRLRLDGDRS